MNPESGRIYYTEAEVAAARARGEQLVDLTPNFDAFIKKGYDEPQFSEPDEAESAQSELQGALERLRNLTNRAQPKVLR